MQEKKQFFLQKISAYNHNIEKIIENLDKSDAIMILLSIYETHSLEIQDIREKIKRYPVEQSLPVRTLYLNNVMIQTSILKLLEYILKMDIRSHPKLDQIVEINTLSVIGITDPDDPSIQNKLRKRFDFNIERDALVGHGFALLGGTHTGLRIYVIKKFHELVETDQIILSFELMNNFHQKQICETYLKSNKNVEVDKNGIINIMNITVDD